MNTPLPTSPPLNARRLLAVAGGYSDGTRIHGFVLEHGRFTTIDFPGDIFTEIVDVNERGDVAGLTWTPILDFTDSPLTRMDSPASTTLPRPGPRLQLRFWVSITGRPHPVSSSTSMAETPERATSRVGMRTRNWGGAWLAPPQFLDSAAAS